MKRLIKQYVGTGAILLLNRLVVKKITFNLLNIFI